jgi:hypothetical protein
MVPLAASSRPGPRRGARENSSALPPALGRALEGMSQARVSSAKQVRGERGTADGSGVAGRTSSVLPANRGEIRRRPSLPRGSPTASRWPDGAGSPTVPSSASTPQGTCESAMNAASRAGTSAANEAANFSRPRNRKPSCGGRIGGTGAPGGGSAISVLTDSPASGANAAMKTRRRRARGCRLR